MNNHNPCVAPEGSKHAPRQHGKNRKARRLHAAVVAAFVSIAIAPHGHVHALVLGKVAAQSTVGEPLKAEIDIPGISDEEAASLRVGLAESTTLRAAGLEVHPALANLQVILLRRPDGRAFFRLTSPHPVNEKFVDLIIEANWASGRILRDYTIFLNPPAANTATQPPAQPSISMTRESQASAQKTASPSTGSDGAVHVQTGDTAGAIALIRKPPGVSLDQMLVAMLQQNPNAFVAGNVNRLRAGALLDMPSQSNARLVASGEARKIIAAQSRDFNALRRRLAMGVPNAMVNKTGQHAIGPIGTEVRADPPKASAADHLTLSKDGASSVKADQIAKERQTRDASTRVAELSRNIDELTNLQAPASPLVPSGSAAPAPTALSVDSSTTVPDEPSFFARLHNNPKAWLVVGLLAIAAGLSFYRYRHRLPQHNENETQPT